MTSEILTLLLRPVVWPWSSCLFTSWLPGPLLILSPLPLLMFHGFLLPTWVPCPESNRSAQAYFFLFSEEGSYLSSVYSSSQYIVLLWSHYFLSSHPNTLLYSHRLSNDRILLLSLLLPFLVPPHRARANSRMVSLHLSATCVSCQAEPSTLQSSFYLFLNIYLFIYLIASGLSCGMLT